MLAGNVRDAGETHGAFYGVWRRHGFTPEGFNLAEGRVRCARPAEFDQY